MADSTLRSRNWRGLLQLTLILLLFGGPLLVAWFLYQNPESWQEGVEQTNYGELISPPRSLQDLYLKRVGGGELHTGFLRGKWTLIYIGSSDCSAVCRDNLYKMRQVHIAQGENMGRVQRLYIATNTEQLGPLGKLLEEQYPRMTLATLVDSARERVLTQFRVEKPRAVVETPRVYLVDPMANLMMYYPPQANPSGLLDDLEHLLKTSRFG